MARREHFNSNQFFFLHGSPNPDLRELDPKSETMIDRVSAEPNFEDRWPEHMLNEDKTAVLPEYAHTGELYGYSVAKPGSYKMYPREDLEPMIEDAMGYGGNIHIGIAPTQGAEFDFDTDPVIITGSKIPVLRTVKGDWLNPKGGVKNVIKALKELGLEE